MSFKTPDVSRLTRLPTFWSRIWDAVSRLVRCLTNSWGPFLTSPLGAKLAPRGEFGPPGANFGGEVIPWGWNYLIAPPFF
jgi:hypothetical protein